MTERWHSADQVFDGRHLLTRHGICLSGGIVSAIKPLAALPQGTEVTHHKGLITPGFFDIQVNGGGGVLLNTSPTVEGVATILAAHRKFGTTALLPTVITDGPKVLEQAAAACLSARDLPGAVGIHIEGPHISSVRRGTHANHLVRPMDAATLSIVGDLRAAGLPVLITVAPEVTAPAQISQLRDLGAVVSIGHTDASADMVQAALSAGATGMTHLFNAMSPMLHREPGAVGAGIASDAWCSIIADGLHVDPIMIAIAVRARPLPDRMVAISDAMSTVDGPDNFDLYGQHIQLRDGRLYNEEGSLAGAHLTMHGALKNLVNYGVSREDALRMCCHNPAQMMGLWDRIRLLGRVAEDVLLLDSDLTLRSVGIAREIAAPNPA